MTFRPDAIRGNGLQAAGGVIDYRLARMGVVSEYRKGRLARHEVCDAHPELKRAAQSASEPTDMECPICEEDNIVLVTYAFGSRLPASGRCITTKGELAKLAKGRAAARRLRGRGVPVLLVEPPRPHLPARLRLTASALTRRGNGRSEP